ncbi:MAG: hypothetical protein L0Y73_06540, partial [Candidatus Aminicenantes bacterium]|nr:hypothetical protein [Candidatus Aminicenantes bacterium]
MNARLRTILIDRDTHFQAVIIGILVGICSGLAAVGLNYGLEKCSHFFNRFAGHFYVVLLPLAGITFTVFLLKYIIKDFGGHGVP